MIHDKPLPSNKGVEVSLIANIFMKNDLMADCIGSLQAKDFYYNSNLSPQYVPHPWQYPSALLLTALYTFLSKISPPYVTLVAILSMCLCNYFNDNYIGYIGLYEPLVLK